MNEIKNKGQKAVDILQMVIYLVGFGVSLSLALFLMIAEPEWLYDHEWLSWASMSRFMLIPWLFGAIVYMFEKDKKRSEEVLHIIVVAAAVFGSARQKSLPGSDFLYYEPLSMIVLGLSYFALAMYNLWEVIKDATNPAAEAPVDYARQLITKPIPVKETTANGRSNPDNVKVLSDDISKKEFTIEEPKPQTQVKPDTIRQVEGWIMQANDPKHQLYTKRRDKTIPSNLRYMYSRSQSRFIELFGKDTDLVLNASRGDKAALQVIMEWPAESKRAKALVRILAEAQEAQYPPARSESNTSAEIPPVQQPPAAKNGGVPVAVDTVESAVQDAPAEDIEDAQRLFDFIKRGKLEWVEFFQNQVRENGNDERRFIVVGMKISLRSYNIIANGTPEEVVELFKEEDQGEALLKYLITRIGNMRAALEPA